MPQKAEIYRVTYSVALDDKLEESSIYRTERGSTVVLTNATLTSRRVNVTRLTSDIDSGMLRISITPILLFLCDVCARLIDFINLYIMSCIRFYYWGFRSLCRF